MADDEREIRRLLARLDTHCLDELEVARAGDGRRISSITQKVLWSEGDPTIHAGSRRRGGDD